MCFDSVCEIYGDHCTVKGSFVVLFYLFVIGIL